LVIGLVASFVVMVTTWFRFALHAPTPSELPTLKATRVTPAGGTANHCAVVTGSSETGELE
jgi:hypothetical protein